MPPVLRSILAIIAGFVTMSFIVNLLAVIAVVLTHQQSGHPMPGYLVFNVIYRILAATGGGIIAAIVAGRKPIEHGSAMAGIMLVFGLIAYRHLAGQEPLWYQWTAIIVPPLCVIAGVAIVARRTPIANP